MPTENTSFQNTTPAGDSTTTNVKVIGKSNTHQRSFLIVASSLLVLLVLVAVAGESGGQPIPKSAGALVDYQLDTTNLALGKDIFGKDKASLKGGDGTCTCRVIGTYKPYCDEKTNCWACCGHISWNPCSSCPCTSGGRDMYDNSLGQKLPCCPPFEETQIRDQYGNIHFFCEQ